MSDSRQSVLSRVVSVTNLPDLPVSYKVLSHKLLDIYDAEIGSGFYSSLKNMLAEYLKNSNFILYSKKPIPSELLTETYQNLMDMALYTEGVAKTLNTVEKERTDAVELGRKNFLVKVKFRCLLNEIIEIQEAIIQLHIEEKGQFKAKSDLQHSKKLLISKLQSIFSEYKQELASIIIRHINPNLKNLKSTDSVLRTFIKKSGIQSSSQTVHADSVAKKRWQHAAKMLIENELTKKVVSGNNKKSLLLSLSSYYWLEKLDPKHRNIAFLRQAHKNWQQDMKNKDNFFTWLDKKEYRQEPVEYCKDLASRRPHKIYFKNGLIVDKNGQPLDTTRLSGKKPGYVAFVLAPSGQIYVAPHIQHKRAHSSFLGGSRVLCAGMIKVVQGKVMSINNESGHYKPHIRNLQALLRQLPMDVFSPNASITYSSAIASQVGQRIVNMNVSFLKRVGELLQVLCIPHKMTREKFIAHCNNSEADDQREEVQRAGRQNR